LKKLFLLFVPIFLPFVIVWLLKGDEDQIGHDIMHWQTNIYALFCLTPVGIVRWDLGIFSGWSKKF